MIALVTQAQIWPTMASASDLWLTSEPKLLRISAELSVCFSSARFAGVRVAYLWPPLRNPL